VSNEVSSARRREVVEVEFRRGRGVTEDPVRRVVALYDPETGELVAENDPCAWAQDEPLAPKRYMDGRNG
jgi:hypothetical protein